MREEGKDMVSPGISSAVGGVRSRKPWWVPITFAALGIASRLLIGSDHDLAEGLHLALGSSCILIFFWPTEPQVSPGKPNETNTTDQKETG